MSKTETGVLLRGRTPERPYPQREFWAYDVALSISLAQVIRGGIGDVSDVLGQNHPWTVAVC